MFKSDSFFFKANQYKIKGIGDMGVWSGPPGANRYSPITPGYRHNYEHQQKMHQYPTQQVG